MNAFANFRRLSRAWRSQVANITNYRIISRAESRQINVLRQTESKTKLLESSKSSRYYSRFAGNGGSRRFYSSGSKDRSTPRQSLWRILRVLFIVTGGAVWGLPALVYLGYLTGFVEIDTKEKEEGDVRRLGSDEYNDRMLVFYDISKKLEGEEKAKEIGDKQFALMQIWNKLRSEDGVVRKFGKPVQLSGFQVMANKITNQLFNSDEDNQINKDDAEIINDPSAMNESSSNKSDTHWMATCYVEGPKLTGVMQAEFNKVNAEWVPVSIHLETIQQKTGEVICDVSAPLPNGVSRFIRLSNDYSQSD